MKSLVAALAAAGLLPSGDMTDEALITTTFNRNLPTLKNAAQETELKEIKERVKKFEDGQKTRVTAKVEQALTDKLVKVERKNGLIDMGVRDETELDNYLADLREARGSAAPVAAPAAAPRRQGAPPVPPVDATKTTTDNDAKIVELQNELKSTSDGGRRVEISRELRELRGHKNLFEQPAPATR